MISINCDMGESFGIYRMGDDSKVMPYITHANIACGFHGSDPNHMHTTVKLAKEYGVKVGAHVSLPDLQGFGRREMVISREEMRNMMIYQIGALKGFLSVHQMQMSHLKPHGALYGMSAKQAHIAEAVADVATMFDLPIMGMSNTLHESVARQREIPFIAEFFADLDYADDGSLVIAREHESVPEDRVVAKVIQAIQAGTTDSINNKEISVKADTICVHSDTPNALKLVKRLREALSRENL